MNLIERIDSARYDFVREYPDADPFAVAVSKNQYDRLLENKLALARMRTTPRSGRYVRTWAGMVILVFKPAKTAREVMMTGPAVMDEREAMRLFVNGIADAVE